MGRYKFDQHNMLLQEVEEHCARTSVGRHVAAECIFQAQTCSAFCHFWRLEPATGETPELVLQKKVSASRLSQNIYINSSSYHNFAQSSTDLKSLFVVQAATGHDSQHCHVHLTSASLLVLQYMHVACHVNNSCFFGGKRNKRNTFDWCVVACSDEHNVGARVEWSGQKKPLEQTDGWNGGIHATKHPLGSEVNFSMPFEFQFSKHFSQGDPVWDLILCSYPCSAEDIRKMPDDTCKLVCGKFDQASSFCEYVPLERRKAIAESCLKCWVSCAVNNFPPSIQLRILKMFCCW